MSDQPIDPKLKDGLNRAWDNVVAQIAEHDDDRRSPLQEMQAAQIERAERSAELRRELNAVAKAASTALMLGSRGVIEPRSIRTDAVPPYIEVVHDGERYRLVVEKL